MEQPGPYPSYPGQAPYTLPPRQDQRPRVLGILNIVFGVIYVGCAGFGTLTLLSRAGQQLMRYRLAAAEGILTALYNGVTFLLLLIGGILLLQRFAAGRALTFISGAMAAIYLVVDIALTVAFLRSGLPGGTAATGLLGASAFLGIPIRAAYPIVSALVLISRPENMDLH